MQPTKAWDVDVIHTSISGSTYLSLSSGYSLGAPIHSKDSKRVSHLCRWLSWFCEILGLPEHGVYRKLSC